MIQEPEHDGESGIALLMVMLGLAVLSVVILGIVLATRSGVVVAQSDLQASEMQAYSDAVVLTIAESMLDKTAQDQPRIDGVQGKINVLGRIVLIAVTSEFGKVDLNATDSDTLERLYEAAGLGPSEAMEEATQTVSWRLSSGENNSRLFRSIAELTQVPGITLELYQHLAPSITVDSGRGRVDESTAPLLALEAAGMDRLSAEALIHDRLGDQASQQNGEVVNGRISQGIDITGWAFLINAQLTLGRSQELLSVAIRMTGDPTRPYFELWRREMPD